MPNLTANWVLRSDLIGGYGTSCAFCADEIADGIFLANANTPDNMVSPAFVLRSRDGVQFENVANLDYPARAIHGTPVGEEVWVGGDRGYLLKTEDGGDTWTSVVHPLQAVYAAATSGDQPEVRIEAIWVVPDGSKVYTACQTGISDTGGSARPAQIYSSVDGGANWVQEQSVTGYHPRSLSGLADGSVYVAGTRSVAYSSSGGGTWTVMPTLPTSTSFTAGQIVAVSATEVYARMVTFESELVGSHNGTGSIIRFDGTAWSTVTTGLVSTARLEAIHASAGHLYVAAWDGVVFRGLVLHSTDSGSSFTTEFSRAAPRDVVGSPGNTRGSAMFLKYLFAAPGEATPTIFLQSYTSSSSFAPTVGFRAPMTLGAVWTACYFDRELATVWGTGTSNIFVGSDMGLLLQWNGINWTPRTLPPTPAGYTAKVTSIWGSGTNDVYVADGYTVTTSGVVGPGITRIFRSTDGGATWTQQYSSTSTYIKSLWGSGVSDVWAVGGTVSGAIYANGVVLRNDGTGTWSAVTVATGSTEYWKVMGTGPSDVWVVGSGRNIFQGSAAGLSLVGSYPRYPDWSMNALAADVILDGAGGVRVFYENRIGPLNWNITNGWTTDLAFTDYRSGLREACQVSTTELYVCKRESASGFTDHMSGALGYSAGDGVWRHINVANMAKRQFHGLFALGARVYGITSAMGLVWIQGPPANAVEPTVGTPTTFAKRRWVSVPVPTNHEQGGSMCLLSTGSNAGRAMLVGGFRITTTSGSTALSNLVDIFDPETRTWASAAPMAHARGGAAAVKIDDGRVVVFGGRDGLTAQRSVEIYDPVTNTWAFGADFPSDADIYDQVRTQLLPSGRILVLPDFRWYVLIYDPTANSWSTVRAPILISSSDGALCVMPAGPHVGKIAILDPNGDFVVFNEDTSEFTFLAPHRLLHWRNDSGSECGMAAVQGKIIVWSDKYDCSWNILYDPLLDVWFDAGADGMTGASAVPAVVMDEGVLMLPFGEERGVHVRFYDPVANSWFLGPAWPAHATRTVEDGGYVYDPAHLIYIQGIKLPNNEVLIAGTADWWGDWSSERNWGAAVLEVDPADGGEDPVWEMAAHMRTDHAWANPGGDLVPLADGTVLAFAGRSAMGSGEGGVSVEGFNPTSRMWSMRRPMRIPREGHQSTLLLDGRVLITGGTPGLELGLFSHLNTSQAEIYTPTTNVWAWAGSMSTHRAGHRASLITVGPNVGRVLVTGGMTAFDTDEFHYLGTATCEMCNPTAGTWSAVASMTRVRWGHAQVVLLDGRVLVVGGTEMDPEITPQTLDTMGWAANSYWGPFNEGYFGINRGEGPGNHIEIYNPTTNAWTEVATTSFSRFRPRATLLGDGRVFIYQGLPGEDPEIFDPTDNSLQVLTGHPLGNRQEHSQTALPDGRLLICGGADLISAGGYDWYDYIEMFPSAYVYDPEEDSFTEAPDMSGGRHGHGATLLADGGVLVAGGYLSYYVVNDTVGAMTAASEVLVGLIESVGPAFGEVFTDVYSGPRVMRPDPLGAGIVRPFLFVSHGDLQSDQGVPTVLSDVGQIFGTAKGTFPWRPEFGSDLQRLRHRSNNQVLRETASLYVSEALDRWQPRVKLTEVSTEGSRENQVSLRATVRIAGASAFHTLDLRRAIAEGELASEMQLYDLSDGARSSRGMAPLVQSHVPISHRPPKRHYGPVRPFIWRSDLRAADGLDQILSQVGQVLGTEAGTLPWDPSFGSDLQRLRHRANNPVLRELAMLYVDRALKRYVPLAAVSEIEPMRRRAGGAQNVVGLKVKLDLRLFAGSSLARELSLPVQGPIMSTLSRWPV